MGAAVFFGTVITAVNQSREPVAPRSCWQSTQGPKHNRLEAGFEGSSSGGEHRHARKG